MKCIEVVYNMNIIINSSRIFIYSEHSGNGDLDSRNTVSQIILQACEMHMLIL